MQRVTDRPTGHVTHPDLLTHLTHDPSTTDPSSALIAQFNCRTWPGSSASDLTVAKVLRRSCRASPSAAVLRTRVDYQTAWCRRSSDAAASPLSWSSKSAQHHTTTTVLR